AAGLLQRFHLLVADADAVAGAGDELHLLVGEVALVVLGGLHETVDELLAVLDLADVAGEHLICLAHGGVLPGTNNGGRMGPARLSAASPATSGSRQAGLRRKVDQRRSES